jgi:ankyrin repeat protein
MDSHEEVVLETSIELTPLHIAAREGNLEIASLLLNSGVVNALALDSRGFTALHFAAAYGHTRVLELLLVQSDAPVNVCDFEGLTPLFHSVIGAHLEGVKSLLKRVPEETMQLLTKLLALATQHGVTHRPVALHLIGCIESLLQKSHGKFDSTIIHWAARKGDAELIELILPWRPDDANARNKKKQTPLHLATLYGTIETVRSLCSENGWRLRATDQDESGGCERVHGQEL